MQDERFGRAIRALRRRRALRQSDVAAAAGVSQATVSRVEHGQLDRLQVETVRVVATAVGAEWDPSVRWRGGELDRLLDEAHAGLVGVTVQRLHRLAWESRVEVTYAVYGERGSIDILAWHARARMLLVLEVKSTLNSLEETLRRQDAKVRLARRIADERFGWHAAGISSLLVLPSTPTARRRVARLGAVLGRTHPIRGADVRAWLKEPRGPVNGLLFVSTIPRGDAPRTSGRAGRRPRRPRPPGWAPSVSGMPPEDG